MTKYKLGDVCEIFGRIGFRGYTAQDLVESPKDGAITLSPTNIVNGELDFTNSTYLSWDKYEESPEIKINENDIVVVKTASVGKCALVRKLPHPTTLNPQFVVLKKIQADPVYLSYIIKGKCFQSSLKAITAGSVVPTLSQKHMADIEIYLPDLKIQKKIASVLSALDDKIALNKKMNQKLEAMAKRLYDYWFVQYDFPDKNGHPYKTTGGPMTYNTILKREIPAGWEVKQICDITKIFNGSTPSTTEEGNYGGEIVWITPKDLSDQNCKFVYQGARNITQAGYDSCSTTMVPKGTVVMSSRAPIGLLSIAQCDLCTNQGFKNMVPNDMTDSKYLYYTIQQHIPQIQNLGTGTTFKEVSKDELGRFAILYPPKKLIAAFEEKVAPIFDVQFNKVKEISRLIKLRDKLLPLLMNGQVEVK